MITDAIHPCLCLETGEEPVLDKIRVARKFHQRAIGLLATSSLKPTEGFIIPNCASIHTFGMRFPIDVIFFDDKDEIRGVYPDIPSGYILFSKLKNVNVLETSIGFIEKNHLQNGDKLHFSDGK